MKKILSMLLVLIMCVPSAYAQDDKLKKAYYAAGEYLQTITPSFGNEWNVMGIARSGAITKEYKNAYYDAFKEKITQTNGAIGKSSTDYTRAIIGITSIGKDATNVCGYNLIEMLTEEAIKRQGLNGAVYALLALDTKPYESEVDREWLVDLVLVNELAGGGWTFWGNEPDPDMTSMAVTALAPYYTTNEKVKEAVDSALVWLSETQCDSGAYASYGSENPESTAQVLVALTALGIDPDSDERFIKKGNTIPEAIAEYAVEDGGFAHSIGGTVNSYATQQSYYALAAYYRFKNGDTSLYDMSDLKASVDVTADGTVVTYSNCGSATAYGVNIIAAYNSVGRLINTKSNQIEIPDEEEYKIEIAQSEKSFLWNGIEPMCVVKDN